MLSERNKKECIACCKRILKDVSASKSDVNCVQDRFLFTIYIGCKSAVGHMNTVTKQSYKSTQSGSIDHYQKISKNLISFQSTGEQ